MSVTFMKGRREDPDLFKIGNFTCFRRHWIPIKALPSSYRAVRMAEEVQILCERGTMLRYMYIANLFAVDTKP